MAGYGAPPRHLGSSYKAGSRLSTAKMINRFTDLFDRDWKRARSSLRAQTADDRSYDPSYSWDARSDNPKEFSKIEAKDVPVQIAKPITLSGNQVIPLEPLSGQFLHNDPPEKLKGLNIPLFPEQQDVNMKKDLSGRVPICEEAFQEGAKITIKDRPIFANNELRNPTFQKEKVPDFVERAGPNGDGCILTPAQRREWIEFEKRENEARDLIRRATAKREKTKKLISGPLFKRGVIQLDSAENPTSEVYGHRAVKEEAHHNYRAQIHLERRSNLGTLNSSIATNGNILIPTSVAARVKTEPWYQSKGGTYHGLSYEETHNRLFCRQERAGGANRTQNIRNAELSGKQYNIVNMTTIEHWPSRHFDRLQNKTLAHPSQVSLNGSRNLQGSTRPY